MSNDNYVNALKGARSEIEDLLNQRMRIDNRLAQLKEIVDSLSAVVEEAPSDDGLANLRNIVELGITDSIRTILRETKDPAMSPPEIRNELERRGIRLSGYANKMAVIHNTLTRLEKQGEVVKLANREGVPYAYAIKPSYDIEEAFNATFKPAYGAPDPLNQRGKK